MKIEVRWIVIIALAGWFTFADAGVWASGGEKDPAVRTVETPVAIEAILAESDPLDKKTKGPSKTYAFKLDKTKPYVVELISSDFDTFLRVEDAGGKELACDDDSGGGLNSKLKFVPSKDGVYKMVASSLDGKLGKFQLKIRLVEPVKETIPAAKQVGRDGFTLEGKLSADGPADDGRLTKGAPRMLQPVILKSGKTYRIELASDDFDAFVRLEDKAGKELAFDDDSGGDLNSRIVFECKADGEYRIIVTSLDRKPGNFVLKVREK